MPSEGRDDALDHAQDGLLRAERLSGLLQLSLALDVQLVWGVDHDLADGVVRQIELEGTESERLVHHVADQLLAGDRSRQVAGLLDGGDDLAGGRLGPLPQFRAPEGVEIETPQVHRLDELVVDRALHAGVVVRRVRDRRRGCGCRRAECHLARRRAHLLDPERELADGDPLRRRDRTRNDQLPSFHEGPVLAPQILDEPGVVRASQRKVLP